MIIKRFTEPELKLFRDQCNFVNDEVDVFELRSKGVSLERIAEMKGFTYDGIKKVSREVNTKIARIQHLLDA